MVDNFTSGVFGFIDTSSSNVIRKDNVVVVYRDGDDDSEEFADYYLSQWDINPTNKIAVPCSLNEILSDYSSFQSEVENSLNTAISSFPTDVYAVVLGYNVPGGFVDSGDIIAATSRISRINSSFSKKSLNSLYNRQVGRILTLSDLNNVIVCSRIDAPSLDEAKLLINKSIKYFNQYKVNGRFFFDPYSSLSGQDSVDYKNELLYFYNGRLFDLNLEVSSTTFIDEYTDVVTPYLKRDSFYWGVFTDRSSSSFFKETDTARVFFYNADYDSAYTLRNFSQENWAPLAFEAGYISLAGAMSNPTFDGQLRPDPLFASLQEGATIGEAFIFASPYLDWTIGLIGDPLASASFGSNEPVVENPITLENEKKLWLKLSEDLAKSIAHHIKKEQQAFDNRELIVLSRDLDTEVDTLYPMNDLSNANETGARIGRFNKILDNLYNYAFETLVPLISSESGEFPQNLSEYLDYTGYKISRLFIGLSNRTNGMDDEYFYNAGFWEFSKDIVNESSSFVDYHFELQISEDGDFSSIVHTIDSSLNSSGWTYEEEKEVFSPIPSIGVPSSHVGRKIRYESQSDKYLTRATEYYFRIRQKVVDGSTYEYRYFKDIIYT